MSEICFPYSLHSQILVVEKRQLVEEPPLDEICQHKFQVSVAAVLSEHRQLSEEDVVRSISFSLPAYFIYFL